MVRLVLPLSESEDDDEDDEEEAFSPSLRVFEAGVSPFLDFGFSSSLKRVQRGNAMARTGPTALGII